ncbi:hypothetical protein QSJ19_22190 [Gordonia sp. ABSL11-1]|uniref:hypothetical protein n=1 Tax=Gordonia sp. ABSL11-1 TaxID=3053924 RepID=UPI0025745CC2|nr:hypothetical protein [Gordonia sp. ABSL11-1]MDL9948240.1 hypothetical protein [Gordonia sp. ABSL11-1]
MSVFGIDLPDLNLPEIPDIPGLPRLPDLPDVFDLPLPKAPTPTIPDTSIPSVEEILDKIFRGDDTDAAGIDIEDLLDFARKVVEIIAYPDKLRQLGREINASSLTQFLNLEDEVTAACDSMASTIENAKSTLESLAKGVAVPFTLRQHAAEWESIRTTMTNIGANIPQSAQVSSYWTGRGAGAYTRAATAQASAASSVGSSAEKMRSSEIDLSNRALISYAGAGIALAGWLTAVAGACAAGSRAGAPGLLAAAVTTVPTGKAAFAVIGGVVGSLANYVATMSATAATINTELATHPGLPLGHWPLTNSSDYDEAHEWRG